MKPTYEYGGVNSYSKPDEFLIFSVYTGTSENNNEDNEYKSGQVSQALNSLGISYTSIFGMYRGEPEESFLIHNDFRSVANKIMAKYEQTCILRLGYQINFKGDRDATMIYHDGTEDKIGVFTCVPEAEAKADELGYSYRQDIDAYFIIKGDG